MSDSSSDDGGGVAASWGRSGGGPTIVEVEIEERDVPFPREGTRGGGGASVGAPVVSALDAASEAILGKPALHVAAKEGYPRVAEAMMMAGASPTAPDSEGVLAITEAKDDDMRALLEKKPAKPVPFTHSPQLQAATEYVEAHNLLPIFEMLTAEVLFVQPRDLKAHLVRRLKELRDGAAAGAGAAAAGGAAGGGDGGRRSASPATMQRGRARGAAKASTSGIPHLFSTDDLDGLFSIHDVTQSGYISLDKYCAAMEAIGCRDFDRAPPQAAHGRVTREAFVFLAKKNLQNTLQTLCTPGM